MTTAEEYREVQAKEYSAYVAVDRISIDGALAFLPGDPVPASTVERADSPIDRSLVTKAGTKAAAAAQEG